MSRWLSPRGIELGSWSSSFEAFSQAQTYSCPWELIVVDNGSSGDRTRRWSRRLPAGSRYALSSRRSGPAQVSPGTAAAGAALGDYLLFVDDDDRVTPGWLEAMARAAEHADIIQGKDRFVHHGSDWCVTRPPFPKPKGSVHAWGFLPCVSGANSGIRADLFREVGGFNERYKRAQDLRSSSGAHR